MGELAAQRHPAKRGVRHDRALPLGALSAWVLPNRSPVEGSVPWQYRDMSDDGSQPPRSGDEFVRDESGAVVAVAHRVDHDDVDYWTDERFAEVEQLDDAARALAPSLVGLSVDAARNVVAQHQGLSVLFMYPGRCYRPIGVFGQVSASVRNDLVVSAT
jgi:hypothetical protein